MTGVVIMVHSRLLVTSCVLLGLVLCLLTIVGVTGCAALQEMDRQIWSTTPTAEDPEGSKAPPIVELAAAALALVGYGGMGAWIRRSNRNGRSQLDDLRGRIESLEMKRDGP